MYQYLFGPVPSRRLGMSLGVDLVPHKVCTFNCVYCECGRTTRLTTERAEYVPVDAVLAELRGYLAEGPRPDFVTFSGAGEPTLNARLGEVLEWLQAHYPDLATAVLTNASLLSDPQVRRELRTADLVIPSLDAASERTFRRLDRPQRRIDLDAYLQGLEAFRAEYPGTVWLEVMILPGYNDNPEDLRLLREALARIGPDRIQLNTLDRPGTDTGLQPASRERLEAIADEWGLAGVEPIGAAPAAEPAPGHRRDTAEAIVKTLARRPCTAEDLSQSLGEPPERIRERLAALEAEGRVTRAEQERGTFYRLAAS
ncbi:radical SAM protein [Halorhodospira neutriphila]|uniref:Radical SAM protein n=1 Tax=Halorhodospira neutriphila TaxID=168379 RepID=A0ABS1E3W0_9GAMM|nr:radical SAM protein [Halorhodospira neutriphila]MBK1725832.1 radical SAM protein [Halorhodospira neutriphila]